MVTIWMTARRAKALGCTHYAWFMGLVPGFFDPVSCLWVSRSDLLIPVEEALAWMWATMRRLRGEEPDFAFRLGREIEEASP
jgi:hypothetical protein